MSRCFAPRQRVRAGAIALFAGGAVVLAGAAPAAAAASLPAVDLTPSWADGSTVVAVNNVGQVIVARASDSAEFLWTAGRFTPLTYDGTPIQAAALNNLGQVVGTAQSAAGGPIAVRWDSGHATALPVPGDASLGTDINDRGQTTAISVSYATTPPTVRGYLISQQGTARDLGTGLSLADPALLVNQAGQVAGNAVTGSGGAVFGDPTAFLWSGGHLTQLPTLGGGTAVVAGLNNLGRIVGRSSLPNGDQHAALWTAGAITDLGTLGGGSYSEATAINDRGQVVGRADPSAGPSRAFIWSGGQLNSLGIPGESWAVGINASGQVIAAADASASGTTSQQGYLWWNGTLTALGTLGSPPVTPIAINDFGLIVGQAQLASGVDHATAWHATSH